MDEAIALFSGEDVSRSKEIWLVDPAPKVIAKLETAVKALGNFMQSQGVDCAPEQVANLNGDEARAEFINRFKEVQRLKTQLDQYTDLDEDNRQNIEKLIPQDELHAFRGVYLDTAQQLKAQQGESDDPADPVQHLDFEFVLFASAVVDYDYIMKLIARYTENTPEEQRMTREQLIGMIASDAQFIGEIDDIKGYINSLKAGEALNEQDIRRGFEQFKNEKLNNELANIANKHGLEKQALQTFVDGIMDRMIFDGENLSDLLAPLELGWKARTHKELELMEDLIPLLKKLTQGRDISGLAAYE